MTRDVSCDQNLPEDLWKELASFENDTGAEVLTISHNGNLSNGRMFTMQTFAGNPLTRADAELRMRLQPLIEATQIKGDSEAHLSCLQMTNSPISILGTVPTSTAPSSRRKTCSASSLPAKRSRPVSCSRTVSAYTRNPAQAGYAKGVPMGGDLRNAPSGTSPNFLVAAMKDPYSGNLDRVQIIKGWLDARRELHEKVYDVAWSGDRTPGTDGKLPPVGNTVDVANAVWTNTIGSPELIAVWDDPEFDANERAFYYARVIEIPTPRWTAYEANRYQIDMPDNVPMITQERAYTSPIWYTP